MAKTFIEDIEVAGDQLVSKIKELFDDASAKRVAIKDQNGRELLALPLTVGAVAGGVLVVAAPMIAAIGALAGFFAKLHLEVEREGDDLK